MSKELELIGKQQLEIEDLKNKLNHLENSNRKREEWLTQAKIDVNVNIGYSFDAIWHRVLTSYKRGDINFDNLEPFPVFNRNEIGEFII